MKALTKIGLYHIIELSNRYRPKGDIMKIIRVKDSVEGGKVAFELLKEKLAAGAQTLGLATGSTPIEFYKQIVASDLDLSGLRSINLDEYVGLSADNDQSYHHFMHQNLFHAKPFKESFLPNGLAEDLDAETKRYDALLEQYPVDLQILGIGNNGHIGFNEPGTPFEAKTQVVDLAEDTIKANARFFDDESEVPRQAISMGISSILAAKSIILMAYGAAKADAIAGMVNGQPTTDLPASSLQNHPEVYVIVDDAAARKLD